MRSAWLAALVLTLSTLSPPSPLAAQESPHGRLPDDGDSFCGQVFLRADGRVFGHERVTFIHSRDTAEDARRLLESDPEPPIGAERVALWWRISPDSLGAYVAGRDGTVWELRLGPGSSALAGSLRQVTDGGPSPHVASAYAVTTPCGAGEGGDGG